MIQKFDNNCDGVCSTGSIALSGNNVYDDEGSSNNDADGTG